MYSFEDTMRETISQRARYELLAEMREKWCYELAHGHPVFSLKLKDWVQFCKDSGVTENWWELQIEDI